MSMRDIVLIAIKEEAPDLGHMMNLFYTGVGKVNAAITASEVIAKYRPQRIINFGTAGGITVGTGLHQCTEFVQRDMSCEGLGCHPGQTPFESGISIGTPGLICSTGDNFVMNPQLHIPADVVDMEAYAIAKTCERYHVEFLCFKYVSDQANHDAHNDWQQQVSQGQPYYINKLRELNLL
jgi:adenosylhomocysteine nucleosidase